MESKNHLTGDSPHASPSSTAGTRMVIIMPRSTNVWGFLWGMVRNVLVSTRRTDPHYDQVLIFWISDLHFLMKCWNASGSPTSLLDPSQISSFLSTQLPARPCARPNTAPFPQSRWKQCETMFNCLNLPHELPHCSSVSHGLARLGMSAMKFRQLWEM